MWPGTLRGKLGERERKEKKSEMAVNHHVAPPMASKQASISTHGKFERQLNFACD